MRTPLPSRFALGTALFITSLTTAATAREPIGRSVDARATAGEATRMLRSPTISATHVAFVYANNIWVVERAGGNARRLTSFQGQTINPKLSPDGTTIAFSGDYGGNVDVYTMPVDGGEPTRLTWHPGADTVQGWTPDGKRILFASPRATAAPNATPRFWTVPAGGGLEEPMPLPRGYQGKISPDGAHRLSHEHVVGRGAPQLSGRTEPPDLDRGLEDVRSRVAAVDRFKGRRSRLGRRHRVLHLRSRRRRQRLVL
jgi:hypothetical protein